MDNFIKNETKVDTRYVCCATCKFWAGITEFLYPSTVIIDQNNNIKGKCNKTFYPGETNAFVSCQNWEARYN